MWKFAGLLDVLGAVLGLVVEPDLEFPVLRVNRNSALVLSFSEFLKDSGRGPKRLEERKEEPRRIFLEAF